MGQARHVSAGTPNKARISASWKRTRVYLIIFALFLTWYAWPRHWSPTLTLETQHYQILSSATPEKTKEIGDVTETLLAAYTNFFGIGFPTSPAPVKLKMKLFKDRAEFRRYHRSLGWVEAFYRKPYCNAFYSTEEINAWHWMLHEATHQLNSEVAGLDLAQWLDEGLATFFSTSVLRGKRLTPGKVDPNTYPVWWLDEIATSGELQADIHNGSVIPLMVIISGKGGPSMRSHFNLFYIHWWSLAHFLFEYDDGKYRKSALELVERGGGLKDFEQLIGPVERIQAEWYNHVRRLKQNFSPATPMQPGA